MSENNSPKVKINLDLNTYTSLVESGRSVSTQKWRWEPGSIQVVGEITEWERNKLIADQAWVIAARSGLKDPTLPRTGKFVRGAEKLEWASVTGDITHTGKVGGDSKNAHLELYRGGDLTIDIGKMLAEVGSVKAAELKATKEENVALKAELEAMKAQVAALLAAQQK